MPAPLLERALRRPYLPFLVFAVAGQIYLAWPWSHVERPASAYAAMALFVLTCILAVAARRPGLSNLAIVPPVLYLAVLALWGHADAGAPDGMDVIALLAIAWTALFGTMRQVVVTTAAFAAVLILPTLLVGSPDYPAGELRGSVVTTVFALLIAPTARFLVRQLDRESARLDAVLRAATGHSVIACDLDGRITMFNPGAERMLGWRAADVLGRSMTDVLHDPGELAQRAAEVDCAPGLAVLTHAVTADGGMETRDWSYLTHDGARLTVSLAMTGIRNADGHLVGYMGVATDVTDARRTLRTLQSQREIYRMLLDHLPMTTVGVFDENLCCLTMGGYWIAASGTDPESVTGKHIGEFFEAPDRAVGVAIYEAALNEPQAADLNLSTGHVYRFEALPLSGPAGERYVLSVARDVTESRRAEAERERMTTALAVSEANFREAFDGAPIGIALTTVGVDGVERFARVNQAFAGLVGRNASDFSDVPVAEMTHPEDGVLQPDFAARGVGATRLRKRFLHSSGRAVWTEVTYAVVHDQDGAPAHIIKHIQDIRAIKESERALLDALEQQRAATARLRELDKMRREVVGTISHELRTPLTSIRGYLELLAAEPLSDRQQQMIEVVLRNSQRLAALVDNLLVLVKLDAVDATATSSAEVCIQDVARAAIDTVRPEIVERQQDLRVDFAPDDAIVHGDAEQLHRALLNLLSNASKYTAERGRIDVEVAVGKNRVRIAIRDTGIGIPQEEQAQLFDRFFRASTARDLAISGNGLGLAIVKSVVDLHDGTITVESAPAEGSCFTVELPLADELAAAGRAS
jgi:PAS domain S-box-containing protein